MYISVYLPDEPVRYYIVPVPKKIALHEWLGGYNHWVSDGHPFYFEINSKIAEMVARLNDVVRRHYQQNKAVTFYAIERALLSRGDKTIVNDYFLHYIHRPPETVTLTAVTWEKYTACLRHLNAFNPRIIFAEIDETMIARFKNYLSGLKGRSGKMNPATIKSYFDKLKVVLMHAAKKDHLLDPAELQGYFEEVKITVPMKKEGQHLEIPELQRLRALHFEKKDSSLERDRDFFLFQVYTGFYYSDLQSLRKSQLFTDIEHGQYIISERDKNDNPAIVPLFKFPYAFEIIGRFSNNDPDSPLLFTDRVFIEIQAYNRNLKLLAKRAGISRTVSNKTARHTNAQMWIRFGADRPVLSKMMGHEKEQTTQHYYKVGVREVIEGTKGIEFGGLGI